MKSLTIDASAVLAIAEGATTPTPSAGAGSMCWSSSAAALMVWTGSKWTALTVSQVANAIHLNGASAIPTIAAGASAGTTPTVSMGTGSTDLAGQISIKTGTSPTAAGTLATVTFAVPYVTTIPFPILTPANAATAALTGATQVYIATRTLTNMTLTAGSTALTASTQYLWWYSVIQ